MIKNNFPFQEKKHIFFLYNGMKLYESDKTLIEEFFKDKDCPSVFVIDVYNLAPFHDFDYDSD